MHRGALRALRASWLEADEVAGRRWMRCLLCHLLLGFMQFVREECPISFCAFAGSGGPKTGRPAPGTDAAPEAAKRCRCFHQVIGKLAGRFP